ncbi:MAG: metallophosphoesterase [Bacteroidota bacterium]
MSRLPVIIFVCVLFLALDLYAFQALRLVTRSLSDGWRMSIHGVYWGFSILVYLGLLVFGRVSSDEYRALRTLIAGGMMISVMAKLFAGVVLLIGDLSRGIQWVIARMSGGETSAAGTTISRSEFLGKAAIIASVVPTATISFGILSGAHDYRVRRHTVHLPNLPKEFDGLRIAQVSDIHSGSFFNKTAVKGGVEMLLGEKPDVVFFTGDLVNERTREVRDYTELFSKLKAPLGVYSVLGNHDYGDYYSNWSSDAAKAQNLKDMHTVVRDTLGYDLLLNENRTLTVDGASIGLIGVENWGHRFVQHGDLEQAYAGMEEMPVKLLLSHDPSHWDAIVRPDFPDVDITFSGHTHGAQFGVELPNFRWSPSQYIYKQWAGLYQEGGQYLYVNRGYGYIGFPGRIGMPPEITIMELKKGIS